MFLIIFLLTGEPFIHGNDVTAESKNLLGVVDDNGLKVVEELLAAAARGGDFVRYHDGEPETAYAVTYTSGITGRDFVLVGGYSQDVSHVPILIPDLPEPAVTASQVVDRETLIAFVEEAARVYRAGVLSEGYRGLIGIRNAFRLEGGDWKSGTIYLWVVSGGGVTLFHATEPFREGKRTDMTRTDINGVRFAEELIGGARREGRRFLEYYYNDPTIADDDDTGSPKLGYSVSFSVPNSQQKAVIGSGIYLGNQVALDFAHFGNGSAISSDVVLVNLAATPIRPLVYFYDKTGDLIDPGSLVDVGGNLAATEYGAITLQSELEPLGEVTISTNGRGETVTGSVKVISDGPDSPIGGVLRFDVPGVGVAGVGAGRAVRDALFPARRQDGGIDTGVALRNLSQSELTLTCHLMMGGEVLEKADVPLPGNGQESMFISQMFEHDTSDFTGSVRCVAPGITQKFTGVAVEMDAKNGIFTTLPLIPLDADTPPEEAMPVTVDISATDSGMALGSVLVEDTVNGARFAPDLTGLTVGEHGFHVHVNPDCGMAGQNAGGHYDPESTGRHEGPNGNGHLGDLPTLTVAEDGTATVPVIAPRIRVSDLAGRSLMVHAGGDNYSDMPVPLGGGGARVACGVILATGN